MNNFRQFSEKYNDWLAHSTNGGNRVYGSKEYTKAGRRVYGDPYSSMRPKDYIADCIRNGWSKQDIIKNCETMMDPKYNLGSGEKRFYNEVIKILQSQLNHSYNDFRDMQEDYLMHFGILGMKWGVRRYQNPDGSLTPEGKARYGTKENFEKYQNTIKKGATAGGILGGVIATHKANKQLKEDLNKKDKNETEGQSKKLDPEAEKRKQQYIQKQNKQIAEAKKIDLEKVRNSFKTDEMKDKWQRAVETDKFDIDFLERGREDWEEIASGTKNEEAARKKLLKDYADYLQEKELKHSVESIFEKFGII